MIEASFPCWFLGNCDLISAVLTLLNKTSTECGPKDVGWTSIIEIIELHKIIGNDFCNNQSNLQSLFCWFDQSKAASFSEL